jgi:hypothetical protein
MPKIVFSVDENLKITTDSFGFKGNVCVKTTEKLLAGLDAKLEKRNLKGEYLEKVKTVDHICNPE